jgi:hypothetical protein
MKQVMKDNLIVNLLFLITLPTISVFIFGNLTDFSILHFIMGFIIAGIMYFPFGLLFFIAINLFSFLLEFTLNKYSITGKVNKVLIILLNSIFGFL